jgi:hypothetical protein
MPLFQVSVRNTVTLPSMLTDAGSLAMSLIELIVSWDIECEYCPKLMTLLQ